MNTVTTPAGRIDQQHPPSSKVVAPRRVPRVALIDRVALRLGVALVMWSRRARVLDDVENRARRVRTALETERRERSMQRDALQLFPLH